MRVPTPVEVVQLVCAVVAIVGLFMIVPVGWFLLIVGLVGVVGSVAAEHLASAQPSESDGN